MARAIAQNLEIWRQFAQAAAYRAKHLARRLEISDRQLRRHTRALFGRSPQDWLNEERLTRAAAALAERRLVKGVCLELGFKQVSHFSRAFKARYGMSPAEYLARTGRNPQQMEEIQENGAHPASLKASGPRDSSCCARNEADWEI